MKYIRKLISFCFVFCALQGCSQNEKAMEQKMLDVYKTVQVYPYQPRYEISFSNDACGFEILVNDMSEFRFFDFGATNHNRIPFVNSEILESGIQTVTIRLYPPTNAKYITSDSLIDGTFCEFWIQDTRPMDKRDSAKTLYHFRIPTKTLADGREVFAHSGEKFYEFTDTFRAEVPYKLTGWKNGKDLRKENQTDLKNEVIKEYEQFAKILATKNVSGFVNAQYEKEIEVAQAMYLSTPQLSAERWKDLKEDIYEEKQMQPMANYEMAFYGNGRIVALIPSAKNEYRAFNSAITYKNTKGGIFCYPYFLQRKQGSNKLTAIR